MTDTDTQSFLAKHPKLMGALFAMVLLLASTGNAAAAMASSISGP
jgi:hypothetical protein